MRRFDSNPYSSYSNSRSFQSGIVAARGAATTLAAVILASMFLTFSGDAGAQARPEDSPTFREGETGSSSGDVIVKFEDDATRAEKVDARSDEGLRKNEDLGLIDAEVDTVRGQSVEQAVRDLEKRPDVEYAEPNFILKPSQGANDTDYPGMYGLNNTGQTGGTADADIDAPEAWNTTTGDTGTVVAVIDQGVDVNHPDLRNNIWVNPDEVPANGIDDDENGYIDDINGWDFVSNNASVYDPDPTTGGGDEHGTHVAGTIAAQGNNSLGVVGVTWKSKIMPLKFLGPNGGATSNAIKALTYAVKEGVKISNNSYGGGGYSQAFADALSSADASGHLFVAAAGNGGADGIGDDNDAVGHYPSSYANGNVVAVAAADSKDTLAPFSNFGATSVDVAAPGVGIRSTLPGNRYASYSGTSMASPYVAGIAALLKSDEPALDDAQLKDRILRYADQRATFQGKLSTGARVNASQAVTAVPTADPAPAPAPAPAPMYSPPPNYAAPTIGGMRPANGSSIRDRTPAIGAVVRDSQTQLGKGNVSLFVDGKRVTAFRYNADTDRLTYTARTLAYGRHTVKVVANDGQRSTNRTWRFTVVR